MANARGAIIRRWPPLKGHVCGDAFLVLAGCSRRRSELVGEYLTKVRHGCVSYILTSEIGQSIKDGI